MLRADQSDVIGQIGTMVYNAWDEGGQAPPRQRTAEPRPPPTLTILTFSNGNVSFPDAVLNKFPVGTDQHIEIVKLKEDVVQEFGAQSGPEPVQSSSVRGSVPRAVGRPDWAIEGGPRPVDQEKIIQLENVPTPSLSLSRLVMTNIANFHHF